MYCSTFEQSSIQVVSGRCGPCLYWGPGEEARSNSTDEHRGRSHVGTWSSPGNHARPGSHPALNATPGLTQPPSYGPEIKHETAKKVATAALAEAVKKKKWPVAVAIVDNHGFLVYYERLDDTQTAGASIAVEKARTAAMFRRPSRSFDERSKTQVSVLGLPGATPITGGLPIVVTARSSAGSASAEWQPTRTRRSPARALMP